MTQFTDLYFKVSSLAAFDALAQALGWTDTEGNDRGDLVSIERIDDLCLAPGVYEDGNAVTPPVMGGPHVNVRLRGDAPPTLDFAGVELMQPENPRRVWL